MLQKREMYENIIFLCINLMIVKVIYEKILNIIQSLFLSFLSKINMLLYVIFCDQKIVIIYLSALAWSYLSNSEKIGLVQHTYIYISIYMTIKLI